MASFSFPKREKLKHKKLFGLLFEQGKSKYRFPLRMIWIKVEEPVSNVPFLCTVSIPKKLFRKATQRNKLKRKLREAYRLNKPNLWTDPIEGQYAILFIYTSKEIVPFSRILKAMDQLTKYLHNHVSQN